MYQFHPAIYMALHPELRFTNVNMAQKHYLENGKKENRMIDIRQLYPDFRSEVYLSLNPDVAKSRPSSIDAQVHWLQKGRYENRQYKPVMLKDTLYLYTDVENLERCTEVSNSLNKLGISNTITQDGNLTTDNLYILFTVNSIKHYPFYFILNLTEYRVNIALLDLALVICKSINNLAPRYSNKIYDLNQIDIGQDILLNKLLVNIGYLKAENKTVVLEKGKLYIIHSIDNKNFLRTFTSQPLYSVLEKSIEILYSIKQTEEVSIIKNIIIEAKRNKIPYLTIGTTNLVFSKNYVNNTNKTLKYLESCEWDIITHVKTIDSIPNLIEIIQIDPIVELLRHENILDIQFMVINNTLYDYIIAWNGSTNLLQYLNAKELKIISLTDLFVG